MTAESLPDLLANPERQVAARSQLRKTLDAAPTTLAYMKWKAALPPGDKRRTVAILSSFTIETVAPFLDVEAYLAGWRADPIFEQYGGWLNGLTDPETLGPADASAVVVLLHGDAVLAPDTPSPSEAIALIASALRSFRARSGVPLFIGLIADAPEPNTLSLAGWTGGDRRTAIDAVNRGIRELTEALAHCYLLDLPAWLALPGSGWFDRAGYLARMTFISGPGLPSVARGMARALACLYRPRRKVLALDLDNSLWGGVVGEDGVAGIAISAEQWPGVAYIDFQRRIKQLRESGILLAINSKNNEADARAVFDVRQEMLLQWSDFSAHRINWEDKATNLTALADELGLGLDSFVFADDSPVECALVRELLPMVDVIELGPDPADFVPRLLETGAFDTLTISAEDRGRAEGYISETRRKQARSQAGSLGDFLAGLDLRLSIDPVDTVSAARAHQLLQKTNQFNLSLHRPTADQIGTLAEQGDRISTAALRDRFGDYGVIAVMELEFEPHEDTLRIANLVISCRALGREVEEAMIAFAGTQARRRGLARLSATFIQGPRNDQVAAFLARYGFMPAACTDLAREYVLDIEQATCDWPAHIDVALSATEARMHD
ncbi:MAG: HAD-IIIC family phosphatase [Alphaproteobacteria bacterium]|nr:HAD-IIIC family phosphatase [Alphaproteobacteria bacterium]